MTLCAPQLQASSPASQRSFAQPWKAKDPAVSFDRFNAQGVDLVTSTTAQKAFDIAKEDSSSSPPSPFSSRGRDPSASRPVTGCSH